MEFELVIFLVMLGVFLLGNFLLKLPVSLSMAAGAIAGALVGGEGIPPITMLYTIADAVTPLQEIFGA